MKISEKKIAILATHGFEQSELEVPRDKLKAAGAIVHIISPDEGEIKGWDKKDWGRPVKVDRHLGDVSIDEYDAILLIGGPARTRDSDWRRPGPRSRARSGSRTPGSAIIGNASVAS